MDLREMLKEENNPILNRALLVLDLVKALGWSSFMDTRKIKPNIEELVPLLKKHKLATGVITTDNAVDIFNPILIETWHVQIIGSPQEAYLQLLTT